MITFNHIHIYVHWETKSFLCFLTLIYPPPFISFFFQPRSILLSVWWNIRRIFYNRLWGNNQIITSNLYCNQLRRLKTALNKNLSFLVNRNWVILHHGNTNPHTAHLIKDYFEDLDWGNLLHSSYSPELVPSDYHLFREFQKHLDSLWLTVEEAKPILVSYFAL